MGAVGALGTYLAASRSAERVGGPNRGGESNHASPVAGRRAPFPSGGAGAVVSEPRGMTAEGEDAAYADGAGAAAYAQDILARSQGLEGGGAAAAFFPFGGGGGNGGDGSSPLAGVADGPESACEASSLLAGEFRRLTEAMEQQTGHLVEAVGAMKALASRAEQDSSSLLAARVSSHTSELRAELGTIKQLLLLQAGVEGGAPTAAAGGQNGGASAAAIAAAGAAGNGEERPRAKTSPEIAARRAEHDGSGSNGGVGSSGAGGVKGATGLQADGPGAEKGPSPEDLEEEKAREGAQTLLSKYFYYTFTPSPGEGEGRGWTVFYSPLCIVKVRVHGFEQMRIGLNSSSFVWNLTVSKQDPAYVKRVCRSHICI